MNALDPQRIEPAAALAHEPAALPLRDYAALLLCDHAALLLRRIRYDLVRWLRTPSFALPALLFPPMFYLSFGVVLNRDNPAATVYLMASYGVFGVMAPALFGFGFGVGPALDRERGLLTLKRALPVPPGAILLARTVLAMLFALAIGVLLQLLGSVLGGVWLALPQRCRR